MCDEKTVEYLRDLIAEKHELEQIESGGNRKAIVTKLLEQGKQGPGLGFSSVVNKSQMICDCRFYYSVVDSRVNLGQFW